MIRFGSVNFEQAIGAAAPESRVSRKAAARGVSPTRQSFLPSAPTPSWARLARPGAPTASSHNGSWRFDACFSAGACLAVLDQALRAGGEAAGAASAEPPFAGALRQRLALRAAARCAAILRLREDEGALRDTEHLSIQGAQTQTSPAGRIHRLWRSFETHAVRIETTIRAAADLLECPETLDCAALAELMRDSGGKEKNPINFAAVTSAAALPLLSKTPRPEAEIFALWFSDLCLAQALGWRAPLPLIATAIAHATLRVRSEETNAPRRRPRPDDADWPFASAGAYALAAEEAQALLLDLSRRAEKLLAIAPKLRAKGSRRVIQLLLSDDAVSPARATKVAGLSDRAARRLFDRLVELGAVRELSGRTTFRLYGL